ncbi:MAG: helix-turn-helix transcriptional regulator [Nocardioidaceae bacterium]
MAKTFAEYAREREATMSPAQRDLMRAFDQAAAFGSVIFGARKARGLRQSDLAELSGVTQADISRIERGQVAPTTQTLLKLTSALGVEIQFVLTDAGTAPADSISLRVPVAG